PLFLNHRPQRILLASVLVSLAAIAGCSSGSGEPQVKVSHKTSEKIEPTKISFVDVAQESGLVFTYPLQPRPLRTLEAFGKGCAAFDADNDGWQDVLLVNDPHPLLFRNTGNGKFLNVTAASGLDKQSAYWTGCAIGDYDGDGLLDVLLTAYHELALFRNLGNLRFEPVTDKSGISAHGKELWSSSAG